MCPDPLPPWELTGSCDALTHELGYFYTETLLLTYLVTRGTFGWEKQDQGLFTPFTYLLTFKLMNTLPVIL